jgi:hypothetical protein
MRPLSSDLLEFIHLLNTKRVRYVIVGVSWKKEECTLWNTVGDYQEKPHGHTKTRS